MRKTISILALLMISGCGLSVGPEEDQTPLLTTPVELTLQFGEEKTVPGTVLRMVFGDVEEDSRCPTSVECVWAGHATVALGIAQGSGPTFPLRMNTVEVPAQEWNDLLVTLLELTPYPVTADPIPKADYAVKVRLEPCPVNVCL